MGRGGYGDVAVVVVLAVVTQRRDLVDAVAVLEAASAGWVLAVAVGALAVLAGLVVVHTSAQRTAGLDVRMRNLVPPTVVAHMLNSVTKSNGLAGLVAFRRRAISAGRPPGAVGAAYLLASVAQQLGFGLVASGAFVVLFFDGRLTVGDVLAGVAFVGYVANATILIAAMRSRSTVRRLYSLPQRVR